MKLKCPAKINLHLSVTGKRDTMHTLDSVMVSVSLFDTVSVKKAKKTEVYMDGKKVGEENSAMKAIRAFERTYGEVSVKVAIKKRIPMMAGLGGSSADAAGVLYALQSIYGQDASVVAPLVGSDVSFMLKGGASRVSGTGNVLSPFGFEKTEFLLVKGSGAVSTPEAYKKFDEIGSTSSFPATCGGKAEFLINCENDLYLPASHVCPEIKETLNAILLTAPLKALMSGSGSAFWAVYSSEKALNSAKRQLSKKGFWVKKVYSLPFGVN